MGNYECGVLCLGGGVMQNKNQYGSNRQIELDLLRIIAMFAVVMVHTCGMNTQDIMFGEANRVGLTIISAALTWEIPAFVMISGRFFLDPEREVTTQRIVKAVVRLGVAFISWDVVYQIYYVLSGAYADLNWKGIISQAIQGPYHFWYIYMMIGLYLVIPFLRRITVSKRLMEYFLVLFLIFAFLTSYGSLIPGLGDSVDSILEWMSFYFVLGFTGYFIAGYYFYRYPLSERGEVCIYIIGILFLIGAVALTVLTSNCSSIPDEMFVKYLTPNVAIETFAVYTFFVKRVGKYRFRYKQIELIKKLSKYSSGIYYIHALTIELFAMTGISSLMLSPFVMVPLLAIVAVMVSSIMVYAIRKIPYVGIKIT